MSEVKEGKNEIKLKPLVTIHIYCDVRAVLFIGANANGIGLDQSANHAYITAHVIPHIMNILKPHWVGQDTC